MKIPTSNDCGEYCGKLNSCPSVLFYNSSAEDGTFSWFVTINTQHFFFIFFTTLTAPKFTEISVNKKENR